MLGLPKSTEISRQLPKKTIFQKFDLKTSQKERFDSDISKMILVNAISQDTLPALQKGEKVETIYVLDVVLKKPSYDPRNILLLCKLIPQKILFALHYENSIQLAIFHTKLISGEWDAMDSFALELAGTTTDAVWDNLVKSVGGIVVEEGHTLAEQIAINDERGKLQREIEKLEERAYAERQPKRKLEMFEQLKRLKEILNNPR